MIIQLKKLLLKIQTSPLTALERTEHSQAGYVAVGLAEFAHEQIVHYDVYVRLPSQRYLHLLSAGEAFTLERLIAYAERGVRELFIRRDSHEKSLAYADLLANTLLTRENIPPLFKLNHQLSRGDVLFSTMQKSGIDENHLEYSQIFVRGVQQSLKALLKQQHLPQTFFKSLSGYEHAVSCSLVATLLALKLYPKATSSNEGLDGNEHDWVGLAAYLHDIGHYHDPDATNYDELDPYHLENLSQYTITERAIIERHSLISADLLSKVKGIAPQVVDAVRNHHERRDMSGYPRKIPANQITLITEVVALSDELIRAFAHARVDSEFSWQKYIEQKVLPSFSIATAKEFRELFLSKSNPIQGI